MSLINPKINTKVERVSFQNRRGEWVPAIPEPYHMFPMLCRCDCGAKFWKRESYDAHYALKHILCP